LASLGIIDPDSNAEKNPSRNAPDTFVIASTNSYPKDDNKIADSYHTSVVTVAATGRRVIQTND